MSVACAAASGSASSSSASAALAVDSRCTLGECVLWCERERVAWWTDIEGFRLWRFEPASNDVRHWRLPDRLGSFALCESGKLLLALAKSLCVADPDAAAPGDMLPVQPLVPVEPGRRNLRCNDGRADRDGRFVFGTLNEDPARAPDGRFYQYSRTHGLRELDLGGVAIPNSIAFDPDGDALYFCDTLQRRILRCRYNSKMARVGRPETFASVEAPASPDGAAIDRRGRLWSAHWGGARVVCYDADGRIDECVDVPTRNPSCVAFGGADFDTLYVSTAREGLDEARLAIEPQAGGLFRLGLGRPLGLPESRFDDQ